MKKRLVRKKLIETARIVRALPESGTQEYSDRVDELIADLRDVKLTLRSGKHRYKYRKESGNLQRAIEALRYLRRQSDRLIKDENAKVDRLVERLQKFRMSGTTPIEQCDVAGTLQALGVDSQEIQKAMSTALTDFVPYYLCDATKAIANKYTEVFTSAVGLFNNIMDDVFTGGVLEGRTKTYAAAGINKFEALNKDNIVKNPSLDSSSFFPADQRRKNVDEKIKKITTIKVTGYGVVDRIFSHLFDDELRSAPVIQGKIGELSEVFRTELSKGQTGSDPNETIKKARITADFLNAVVEIIKKYYEQSYGTGSFPVRTGKD